MSRSNKGQGQVKVKLRSRSKSGEGQVKVKLWSSQDHVMDMSEAAYHLVKVRSR